MGQFYCLHCEYALPPSADLPSVLPSLITVPDESSLDFEFSIDSSRELGDLSVVVMIR